MLDFKNPEFQKLIKDKAREIVDQSKNAILDNTNYQILVNNYLNNFWLNRGDRKDMFVFEISEKDMFELELDKVENSLKTIITDKLKTHSFIKVDKEFKIVNSKSMSFSKTQEARESLAEESKKKKIIFFFGEKGVTKFIEGDEKGENIFLTPQDRINNFEKFKLEDIKEAFIKYKNTHLTKQNNYIKFFVDKTTLSKVYGASAKLKNNLLRNSPEKYLRDDLIDFLNTNVQGTFNREMQLLSSKKPIDIHTESKPDGQLIFFEVKWLGVCIDKGKDKESSKSYEGAKANYRVTEGVVQTLEYIEEVVTNMARDLKCGYLIIFDARNTKTPLEYNDAKIPVKHQLYYTDKFGKIDDLHLDNKHPSD